MRIPGAGGALRGRINRYAERKVENRGLRGDGASYLSVCFWRGLYDQCAGDEGALPDKDYLCVEKYEGADPERGKKAVSFNGAA